MEQTAIPHEFYPPVLVSPAMFEHVKDAATQWGLTEEQVLSQLGWAKAMMTELWAEKGISTPAGHDGSGWNEREGAFSAAWLYRLRNSDKHAGKPFTRGAAVSLCEAAAGASAACGRSNIKLSPAQAGIQ